MNVSKKLVAALVAVSSLVGAGAWAAAAGTPSSAVPQVPITQEQAASIALQNVPGAVRATEFENDNGAQRWDVEIVNGAGQVIDVSIDANTGEMVHKTAANVDQGNDNDNDGDYDNDNGGNEGADHEGPDDDDDGEQDRD